MKGFSQEGTDICPMIITPDTYEDVRSVIAEPEAAEMLRAVARTWKKSGLSKNRIEETMIYAGNRGFKRLGLAFCALFLKEAKVISAVFEGGGFEVVSACCMTGGICSDDIGLSEEDKIVKDARQPQCNPVGQALLLNKYNTDLNVAVGLCVGDDTIFIEHSEAPVTILAVKDRQNDHNPLAAVPAYKESLGL